MFVAHLGHNEWEVEYPWSLRTVSFDYACACGAVHPVLIAPRNGRLRTHTWVWVPDNGCHLFNPVAAIIQAVLCD